MGLSALALYSSPCCPIQESRAKRRCIFALGCAAQAEGSAAPLAALSMALGKGWREGGSLPELFALSRMTLELDTQEKIG